MNEKTTKLRELFEDAVKKGFFNGTVLAAEKGEVIFEEAYGFADVKTGRKLTMDTVFEIASVSKQFTASAILLLCIRKIMSLEDKIEVFFPGFPYENISVHNLLNHTSGLPDYMEYIAKKYEGSIAGNKEVIEFLMDKAKPADFAPNEKREYSNTGYVLLASIIEKVSGMPFGDFLKKEFFEPAGMKNSCTYHRRLNGHTIENYAYGYIMDKGEYRLPDDTEEKCFVITLDGVRGDGNVNTTVRDLYIWDRTLREGNIIPHEWQKKAYTDDLDKREEDFNYGYGWRLANDPDLGFVVMHGCGWPGYGTTYRRYLDSDAMLAIFCNMTVYNEERVALIEAATSILAGREYKLVEKAVPVSE